MEPPILAANGSHTVPFLTRTQTSRFRAEWKENVLTLDGGGIRGYATLLIINAIMVAVGAREKEEDAQLRNIHSVPSYDRETDPLTTKSPLPCHYFDYIVGTSTGGIIAILLGRLRMSVNQCLREYKILGSSVFGHRRLLHYYRYSHKKLEGVFKDVIIRNCLDTGSAGRGDDMMYQNDADKSACRTAVLAVEKRKGQDDELHAFTSYFSTPHHEQALGRGLNPSNPRQVYIRDAARATSAAPGFFQEADVNGNVYMDGALKVNNPSRWAWNEAWRKNPQRYWQTPNGQSSDSYTTARDFPEANCPIGVFLSVGTGFRAPQSAFHRGDPLRSIRALLRRAVRSMTDCESVHKDMEALVEQHQFQHYYRFNPQGLEGVRLDQCRRGGRTFRTMETVCNDFLGGGEIQRQIRECAAELVRQRRNEILSAEHFTKVWSHFFQFNKDYARCQLRDGMYDLDALGTVQHHDME